MRLHFRLRLLIIILIPAILLGLTADFGVQADLPDPWWDSNWPYRIAMDVDSPGAAAVALNFSSLFTQIGLSGALLDLHSLRVVPYRNGAAGEAVPYDETYSTLIMDGESLNEDSIQPLPYWDGGTQGSLSLDASRSTQGSSSIKAEIIDAIDLSPHPAIKYMFNVPASLDWSAYETLVYDVWPEVNASAVDQTPDLYFLELLGLEGCYPTDIAGPALAMNQWNFVVTSLKPYDRCLVPDSSALTGIKFFLKTKVDGGYEDGDEVRLWLDNLRLVDQDGSGEIRWIVEPGVDRYYVYFDTIDHAGHPQPDRIALSEPTVTSATPGQVEVGGYFHMISGATSGELSLWSVPPTEKISKNQMAPGIESPLTISAARGEFEPIQLVVNSPDTQPVSISTNDCNGPRAVIPAEQIQIFKVEYVPLTQLSDSYGRVGDWPDPLVPISQGEQIMLAAGKNHPLWVRLHVPPQTPAGSYSCSLSIGNATIPYTLQVWDFILMSSAFLPMRVGVDWDSLMEAYQGTISGVRQPCYDQLYNAMITAMETYHLTPIPPSPDVIVGWRTSLTAYEVEKAHQIQLMTGDPVWWEVTSWDYPPVPNPMVIDRPGLEGRVLPWMAWLDRVDGLYYEQSVDWEPDPWTQLFSNDLSNGDSFLFYPPQDSSLGFNPCMSESNRLIPSIRMELLREGLEDYAYLYLLNGRKPQIDMENASDIWAQTFIQSRTSFDRSPLPILSVRQALAGALESKGIHLFLPLILH